VGLGGYRRDSKRVPVASTGTVDGAGFRCQYRFHNTGGQIIEVRKGGSEYPLEQYLWSPRYVHAPIVRWRDGNTDGDLEDEGDSTLYYCTDANFNVTALVNASGTVVERYLYDPYGKVTVCDGSWTPREGNASAYSNEVLFTGHRLDPESGLYYTLWRHYHPTLGDWTGRDPKGYVDGMGLYEYVGSCPLNRFDALGLKYTYLVDPVLAGDTSKHVDPTTKKPYTNLKAVEVYRDEHNALIETCKKRVDDKDMVRVKTFQIQVDGGAEEGGATMTFVGEKRREEFKNALEKQKASVEEIPRGVEAATNMIAAEAAKAQKGDQIILQTHTIGSTAMLIGGETVPLDQAGSKLGNAFKKTNADAAVVANCTQTQEHIQAIANVAGVRVGGTDTKEHAAHIHAVGERQPGVYVIHITTPFAQQPLQASPAGPPR